jgi:hypothetical protein
VTAAEDRPIEMAEAVPATIGSARVPAPALQPALQVGFARLRLYVPLAADAAAPAAG